MARIDRSSGKVTPPAKLDEARQDERRTPVEQGAALREQDEKAKQHAAPAETPAKPFTPDESQGRQMVADDLARKERERAALKARFSGNHKPPTERGR